MPSAWRIATIQVYSSIKRALFSIDMSLKHAALAATAVLVLSACGGSDRSAIPSSLGTKSLPVSDTVPASIELDPVDPAEVVVLSLANVGFTGDAEKVTVSGAVTDVLLKDGTLRFATPGDIGVDQHAAFEIHSGSTVTTLNVVIRTQRPTEALAHVEARDDGSLSDTAPKLEVAGLGPNNQIGNGPLSFHLKGIAGLDLKDDSDGLIEGDAKKAYALKDYWKYDMPTATFTIDATALQKLKLQLPNGALRLALNFVSKDGLFAAAYDLLATKVGTKLRARLVDATGAAIDSSDKKILLKGFNSQIRAVSPGDENGNFIFEGVVSDTYQLTLDDLENPNVVSASTVVYEGSTVVDLTLVDPTVTSDAVGTMHATEVAPSANVVTSAATQDGASPIAREPIASTTGSSLVRNSRSLGSGSSQVFSANAAGENQTISSAINFTVPRGTQNVSIKLTVFTEEYPVYTAKQSLFNDTWAYAVLGLPAVAFTASGSVNSSHFTQGTITKTQCVDVSRKSEASAFVITGVVSATNIGDSKLPTVTTAELSIGCAGLTISSALFSSPNADTHPILDPVRMTGNLSGPYLSIQQNATDATHTLPLEINYSPPDAVITEVNVGLSSDGSNPSFDTNNLLSQSHTDSDGKIKFRGLSLPPFSDAMRDGKVVVTVRVKGTIDGIEAISDPVDGGQVSFENKYAFTPLYLANNVAPLAARRYGTRDAGGDSWATKKTIDWLSNKPYRFDDIAAQHVTQTANGRSILQHSGHSDGQQIDLRYADGQGGYSDGLGGQGDGAAIQNLINAAAAEVASNMASKPKLAALRAWITANRTMLDAESANAMARVIYIGPSFIKLALIDAKFSASATNTIPGMQPWTKPARVVIDPAHLSHWHLSLKAHP